MLPLPLQCLKISFFVILDWTENIRPFPSSGQMVIHQFQSGVMGFEKLIKIRPKIFDGKMSNILNSKCNNVKRIG
jgi:hypothetical protein